MSFPRDAYPYTNFHELNLGYFIVHFREIFSQWADLYDQMLDWKDATTDELAAWKTGVEADLDQREAALRAELEAWKAQTGQDIAGWEDATLAALTAWQTATQAVFEAIRVEAAGSATAAAASATAAATAKTAAETAQAAAEAAATSVQASAAQIATNTGDIAELKTQMNEVISATRVTQADDIGGSENFVINDGSIYAISRTLPYNCAAFDAKQLKFQYRRRSSAYQFYVGVLINGHFVGCQTNIVNSEVKEIYDTSNTTFSSATIITSIADDTYDSNFYNFTATVKNNIFSLSKENNIILSFSIDSSVTISGIAFLNYQLASSQSYGPDLINCQIITDVLAQKITNELQYMDIVGTKSNYRIVAGAIRNSGNGWDFIVDENHRANLNCTGISTDANNNLIIQYAAIDAKKIISFIIAPDETFASAGYLIGASVGKTAAYCQISQAIPDAVSGDIVVTDASTMSIEHNNGISAVSWDSENSRLTITHRNIQGKTVNVTQYKYGRYNGRLYSSSATSTTIEFYDSDWNKVTTPNGYMSFAFTRQNLTNSKTLTINPDRLVSGTGNFWFIGIFEV